jgi:hypothetical protein
VLSGSFVETQPGFEIGSDLASLPTSRSGHFRPNATTGNSDSMEKNRLVTAQIGVRITPKFSNEGPFHALRELRIKSRGPRIDPDHRRRRRPPHGRGRPFPQKRIYLSTRVIATLCGSESNSPTNDENCRSETSIHMDSLCSWWLDHLQSINSVVVKQRPGCAGGCALGVCRNSHQESWAQPRPT